MRRDAPVPNQRPHAHLLRRSHACAPACTVLVFSIGKVFLPGGGAFEALLIWICSLVGAHIAHFVSGGMTRARVGASCLLVQPW